MKEFCLKISKNLDMLSIWIWFTNIRRCIWTHDLNKLNIYWRLEIAGISCSWLKTLNFYLLDLQICNEGSCAADNDIPPAISLPQMTIFTCIPSMDSLLKFCSPLLHRALYDQFRQTWNVRKGKREDIVKNLIKIKVWVKLARLL